MYWKSTLSIRLIGSEISVLKASCLSNNPCSTVDVSEPQMNSLRSKINGVGKTSSNMLLTFFSTIQLINAQQYNY